MYTPCGVEPIAEQGATTEADPGETSEVQGAVRGTVNFTVAVAVGPDGIDGFPFLVGLPF